MDKTRKLEEERTWFDGANWQKEVISTSYQDILDWQEIYQQRGHRTRRETRFPDRWVLTVEMNGKEERV
jgi:hypothetical protein